ncbi:MAG TPA: hypothetical protein VJ801_10425 [Polyangia bacterium]|nr:hypothetical protein [Polyangia bacterium]
MPSPVTVSQSGPGFAQVMKDLERIRQSEVLVGIPAEGTGRLTKQEASQRIEARGGKVTKASLRKEFKVAQASPGSGINNASLLFVHSKGSPLRGLPARPVLEPAIEKNRDLITPHLGAAAQALLDGRPREAEQELKRSGVIAANAAKRYFVDGNLTPNKPATIKRKGSSRPLVDTGQMGRSILSVVRIGR